MKKLYAYIRVSTVKQGEHGSSLQEQRAAIEAYARRFDLTIVEWFEEKETAAKRGRTVFTKMLHALQRGQATGVIIHKIDRSARNLKDWADLGELIDRGIEVHFAHESLDLHSRGGRLSADIQAVVAADYIRNLREEVRKGFVGRLKQGLYPLPAPLGYRNQGRGLPKSPDPITAPLIRRAFELYSMGTYNLESLGEELYASGLRNRRGGSVTRNGLSTLLNNPFYVGLIYVRSTGETYQGVHTPLVTKSLFDRVQDILAGRTKNAGLKYSFLYRRTLRCANCGYSLIAELQKGHVYYRCHSRQCPRTCVREEDIGKMIEDALSTLRLRPEERAQLCGEMERLLGTDGDRQEQDRQSLKLSLAALDERLARLTDAFIDRLIDRNLFEQRKTALLNDRLKLQEKLRDSEYGVSSVGTKAKKFLELLESLEHKGNLESPLERRDVVKSVTSNLVLNQNSLVISWLSPFDVLANREQSTCGEPYRDTPRTGAKRSERGMQTKKLAHTLYHIIKAHASAEREDADANGPRPPLSSPRPQVHPQAPAP